MKYLDEFRDPEKVRALVTAIEAEHQRPLRLMEVCGGQTHSIVRNGLDTLLPVGVELIHGPGCPVCVTPIALIDAAIEIARMPDTVLCSFGDMLRVPGSRTDLLATKARGGDIRMVYSPMDAVQLAVDHPALQIVFFAVGFETTIPATAMAVHQAERLNLENFSLLVAHVRVPPAIEAILSDRENRIDGFLAAGHVCAVMGYHEYEPLSERFGTPIVVTGFEPTDILQGIWMCMQMVNGHRTAVDNQYSRVVSRAGNEPAQRLIRTVFRETDRAWRGIGTIPDGGLALRDTYQRFDAHHRFSLTNRDVYESDACLSGQVLRGTIKPGQCPAFATTCTPEHPLGATMVSSEGACAAYYRYRRHEDRRET